MLQPYTGSWNHDTAAHLLRRTIFGPTKERIQQAVDEGLDDTLQTLFATPTPVDPPIFYDDNDDPFAGIGETWTDKYYDNDLSLHLNRARSLWSWWLQRMAYEDQTITEKLTLFWHNHFPFSGGGHANMHWIYVKLLRDNCKGNFRELTKEITVNRAMLISLSGTNNVVDEPNENYARELLELFTVGKGDLVGPGDYSNYTEQDIAEIARCLTGWRAWVSESISDPNPPAEFQEWVHDTGTKELSHRFNHQVIEDGGEEEYKTVIDLIFQQNECASHLCRRLYMWFVHYDINEVIESEVISPMAQILIDNDYNIQPALEALLKSEHFFDQAVRGCMIKSPIDFFYSIYNTLKITRPQDQYIEYTLMAGWKSELSTLEMSILSLPSVAGWEAYYQGPLFYRHWINSASLRLRKRMVEYSMLHLTNAYDSGNYGYDFLNLISTFEAPATINDLVDEACTLLYPRQMMQVQKDYFKEALNGGLPDFEWSVEYIGYLNDPTNTTLKQTVEEKLRNMFILMMSVPEFQLS